MFGIPKICQYQLVVITANFRLANLCRQLAQIYRSEAVDENDADAEVNLTTLLFHLE